MSGGLSVRDYLQDVVLFCYPDCVKSQKGMNFDNPFRPFRLYVRCVILYG